MSKTQEFKPMERGDIDHIKELLKKMLFVDSNAFEEIHNYMTELLTTERN